MVQAPMVNSGVGTGIPGEPSKVTEKANELLKTTRETKNLESSDMSSGPYPKSATTTSQDGL